MTWLLIAMIVVPLAVGVLIGLRREQDAYALGLVGALLQFGAGVGALVVFDWRDTAAFQGGAALDWLPALGLRLAIGVDSVAVLLIGLTTLLGPICVLASRTAIVENQRMYYAWLLILQAAMVGVFASRDLLLFYICFEFTLLPMFVLIRVFGSTNRVAAATKFFLYTFTGSLIALAGLFYVVWFAAQQTGAWTLDIGALTEQAASMSAREQGWVLLALMAGFAVKVPLFPVHTWLPLAHTEAPTAGSVILAGVLLKLGTYGIYRFSIPLAPDAFTEYAPLMATLSIVGILYAGLICWVQTDVKKLVAYSSVSHLGFCVLGLVALNATGISGSVLYMLSHGLSTGALFLLIGMMYERYHTRDMRDVSGLAPKMPIWATFVVFFTMASVGLPGLNGFPSELLCLVGTFQADAAWYAELQPGADGSTLGRWYAVIAGLGMVVAAIYLLYMVGKICFGPMTEPAGHADEHHHLPSDLTGREIATLVPLAVGCLVFGLFPRPLLVALDAPVRQTVAVLHGTGEIEVARAADVDPARSDPNAVDAGGAP